MKKQDYISDATKKIYNFAECKAVSEELSDHIDTKKEFWQSIDYDAETAENKAVEAMGDASLVQDDFAEIHNDSYNPVFDIVTLLLHAGLLGGGFWLLKKYVFDDGGMMSTLLASAVLVFGLALADISLTLKRKKLVPTLFSLVRTGGAGVFLYYLFVEIGKLANSEIATVIKCAFSSHIPTYSNYYNKTHVRLTLCILAAVCLVGIITSLAVWIKTQLCVNKRIDNLVRRRLVGVYRYFAVLFLSFAVFFAVKQFIDFGEFKKEYVRAYEVVQEMSTQCRTAENVDRFIEECKLEFEPTEDVDGNRTGYTYRSGYTLVSVSTVAEEPPEVTDELTEELGEEFIGNYNSVINTLGDGYQIIGADLSVNKSVIKKGYKAITLSFVFSDEEDEDYLSQIVPYKVSEQELYEYYCRIIPKDFSFVVDTNPQNEVGYLFDYLIYSGDFSYEEEREVDIYTKVKAQLEKKKEKTLKTIRKNADLLPDEIAKKTGTKLRVVDYTETIKKAYSKLASPELAKYVGEYKQYRYYDKDGMYYVLDREKPKYNYVLFADEKKNYYSVEYIDDLSEYDSVDENFKSKSVNGWFFDREGKCYSRPEYVAFYTRDGQKYYFRTIVEKTGDLSVGDIKHNYYTNRHGAFYPVAQCFVDEDGYIYFDTKGSVKYDDKGYYKSPSGKKYTKPTETAWDEDGSLIAPVRLTKLQKAFIGEYEDDKN
ncbi:MAG: hypothetical protein E7571_06135 [Ruminococcaceae bacterium]|nr:hypothetical protein [Oscillospiraceae bacterium]